MLSSRTIEKVVTEIDKRSEMKADEGYEYIPLGTVFGYSSKWHWVERAEL